MRSSRLILAVFALPTLGFADAGIPASAAPAPAPAVATPATGAPAATLTPQVSQDSGFALGYQLGRQFHAQFGPTGLKLEDVDMDQIIAGLKKGLAGQDLTKEEQSRFEESLGKLQEVLKGRLEKAAQANLEAGRKFLEENKKRAGVKTTASGLQYEVLVEGKGPKYEGDGSDNPKFKLRYEGHFMDGQKFDGDINGQPVEFGLTLVPGFKEALMTMPCGSKWKLFLPSDLGYGERGAAGGRIPPNSVLVFEVELISFAAAATATTPPVAIPEGK